jgi:hypothetical protein
MYAMCLGQGTGIALPAASPITNGAPNVSDAHTRASWRFQRTATNYRIQCLNPKIRGCQRNQDGRAKLPTLALRDSYGRERFLRGEHHCSRTGSKGCLLAVGLLVTTAEGPRPQEAEKCGREYVWHPVVCARANNMSRLFQYPTLLCPPNPNPHLP